MTKPVGAYRPIVRAGDWLVVSGQIGQEDGAIVPGGFRDEVVKALGGGGETVTKASEIGPALQRAFASGVPYLVNVMTDPSDVYPRTSNLA